MVRCTLILFTYATCSTDFTLVKDHSHEFPMLSCHTRDILAIQGSLVPSEWVFSSAGITDHIRCNHLTHDIFSSLQKLKNAYQRSKLLGLKGQLNPHFLFNCFNTLSGLIDENTEKAEMWQNMADCTLSQP